MTISTERFITFIENRLARTDASNFLERAVIYNAARQALQKVNASHGSDATSVEIDRAQVQRAHNLELAINAIEARYTSYQNRNASAPIVNDNSGIDHATVATSEPSITLDDRVVVEDMDSSALSQANHFRLKSLLGAMAAVVLISFAAFFVINYFAGSDDDAIVRLFPDAPSDRKFLIAGGDFTLQFSGYGNLQVEQPGPNEIARLKLPSSDAPPEQISDFAFVPLEPAYSNIFAGEKIRIGVVARAIERDAVPAQFFTRFHSSELSLTGEPQELSEAFKAYYFDQEIPEKTDATSAEMIVVAPINSPEGLVVEIKAVEVLLSEQTDSDPQ